MSNITYLTSLVSSLAERLNQIEANAKRIFELPQQSPINGDSKFAISRPLDLGEKTEHTTLNAFLEWCIEEMQNIENATRVVQMLPPELLSDPRRIKIPVVDEDDNDAPIVWKILGVDYVEETEVVINIPDASEDNYRKDLILGTQGAGVIRVAGTESEEGIIEPIQPENTVLLTSIVVFGDSVVEDPTAPVIGSIYIKKANWIKVPQSGGDAPLTSVNEDFRHFIIEAYSGVGGVTGLALISFANNPSYQGEEIIIDNESGQDIPLLHNFNDNNGAFTFPNEVDYILKPKERVIFNIKNKKISFSSSNRPIGGVTLTPTLQQVTDEGAATTNSITVGGGLSQVDINEDGTINATGNITGGILAVRNIGLRLGMILADNLTDDREHQLQDKNGTLAHLDDILSDAVDIDYDNTSSGLLAETVQEAVDELSAKKEDRVSVIPISTNTTISALHHGKILLITADVTITFPAGLGATFTGCAFRIATGGKMTPAFASGVTGNGFFADYNPGESLYVFKESNSTNVFYAV